MPMGDPIQVYDYKRFVQAYLDHLQWQNEPYFEGLYKTLRRCFAVRLEKGCLPYRIVFEKELRARFTLQNEDDFRFIAQSFKNCEALIVEEFHNAARAYCELSTPFDRILIAAQSYTETLKPFWQKAVTLKIEQKRNYYELMCFVIARNIGMTDKQFTSADLLALGFDDSSPPEVDRDEDSLFS